MSKCRNPVISRRGPRGDGAAPGAARLTAPGAGRRVEEPLRGRRYGTTNENVYGACMIIMSSTSWLFTWKAVTS